MPLTTALENVKYLSINMNLPKYLKDRYAYLQNMADGN